MNQTGILTGMSIAFLCAHDLLYRMKEDRWPDWNKPAQSLAPLHELKYILQDMQFHLAVGLIHR